MEGAGVEQPAGHDAVAIQYTSQPDHDVGQEGVHQQLCYLQGAVVRVLLAAGFYRVADAVGHIVDGVVQVKVALGGVFGQFAIGRIAHQCKGHRQLAAGVQALVGDKAVDLGQLGYGADVGSDDDLHKGDAVALVAFGGDVAGQLFKVRLVIGKDLRVAARGHDIGSKGYDRVQLFDQMAIRAASEHGAILSNTDKIECEQNETFLL